MRRDEGVKRDHERSHGSQPTQGRRCANRAWGEDTLKHCLTQVEFKEF